MGPVERPVQQVPVDGLARPALAVHKDLRASSVYLASLVLLVLQVILDPVDCKVIPEVRDQKDQLELLESLE